MRKAEGVITNRQNIGRGRKKDYPGQIEKLGKIEPSSRRRDVQIQLLEKGV